MPALDKVEMKVQVRASVFARLERMRDAAQISMSALCGALLDQASSHIEFDASLQARTNEIINNNRIRREEEKKRKGLL